MRVRKGYGQRAARVDVRPEADFTDHDWIRWEFRRCENRIFPGYRIKAAIGIMFLIGCRMVWNDYTDLCVDNSRQTTANEKCDDVEEYSEIE